jgi:hypothetical protein
MEIHDALHSYSSPAKHVETCAQKINIICAFRKTVCSDGRSDRKTTPDITSTNQCDIDEMNELDEKYDAMHNVHAIAELSDLARK